jgi:hypothetical protein
MNNSNDAETKQQTAEIIPLFPKPKKPRTCSFCSKSESEVKHMFDNSSEGRYLKCICNECIVLAKQRIES